MAQPVFIIGSPRSGTSVLTWSLGQHPNLYPLEETVWMGPFGRCAEEAFEMGASRGERSQLTAMGIGRERFLRGLGEAIHVMILEHRYRPAEDMFEDVPFALVRRATDPKRRWIDGTPENSDFVPQLRALFPGARFIHLLRDPASVILSLGNFARIGGQAYPADEACLEWLRHVRPCLEAERNLPAAAIMRLGHRELEGDPESAIRRCLEFLEEPWNDDCLKPLAHRINSSAPDATTPRVEVAEPLLHEVRALCEELGLDVPELLVERAPDAEEGAAR